MLKRPTSRRASLIHHDPYYAVIISGDRTFKANFTCMRPAGGWGSVLRKSLEVGFVVFIVSVVLMEVFWHVPRSALLLLLWRLVVVVSLLRVVVAGSVPVLSHGAHVCEEGLRRAPILVRQVSKAARQIRRG